MPPKCAANGFYMFMLAERNRISEDTKMSPSLQSIAGKCAELWKKLSESEKAYYNELAKLEKEKRKNDPNRDKYRMNNQRQIISERKNSFDEENKRRTQEVEALMKSWDGQDILDIPFHLINFQVMYVEEPVDYYLPMEIGLICFTLRGGINKHLHHFIDPGDVPQGNRHLALKHSEDTHKIPLYFEKADDDFLGLWNQIETFVYEDSQDEILPLFCLKDQRKCVESCLDYIHFHACTREPNNFTKVYTLEDLVMSLIMRSGKTDQKPSERQVTDSLLRNQWDYISTIRCAYHDELDCPYCALAIVRRFSFAVFDLLSNLLNFKLTIRHMPVEGSKTSFTVVHPPPVTRYSDKSSNRSGSRTTLRSDRPNTSVIRFPTPSSSKTSVSQSPSSDSVLAGAWGSPKVTRVEVRLSDSDSSSSDSEALYTDVVKSTSDLYILKELRKPKAPAMVLPQAVSSMITSFKRGVGMPGSRASRPVVGMTMRQDKSNGEDEFQALGGRLAYTDSCGRGISRFISPVTPPPGFGTVTSTSCLYPEDFPKVSSNNPAVQVAALRPTTLIPHSYGRGITRNRGMPPQLRPFKRPE